MNIASERRKSRLLISLSCTEPDTVPFLSELLHDIRRDRPELPIILHLPAVVLGTTDAATRRHLSRFVVDEIVDRKMTLWSAGFSGAALDLLTADEKEKERTWAISNRWKWGFQDVFGVGSTDVRYAPLRCTVADLAWLIRTETMSCTGWGTVSEGMVTPGVIRLIGTGPLPGHRPGHRGEKAGISDLSTLMIRPTAEGAPELPRRPGGWPDLFHLILPRSGIDRLSGTASGVLSLLSDFEDLKLDTVLQPESPECSEEQEWPDGAVITPWVPPYLPVREPVVLAALSHSRRRKATSPDDRYYRTVLLAAADRNLKGQQIQNATERPDTYDAPAKLWELQGDVLGRLTVQENPIQAVFFAGRLAGWASDGRDLPRAQGYTRRTIDGHQKTQYLQTETAAWFTGDRTRAVREIASLDGCFTVETTSVVLDDIAAVIINQRFARTGPADGITGIELFELPLCRVGTDGAVIVTTDAGTGRFPRNNETELTFAGRYLTVETVETVESDGKKVLVTAATPGSARRGSHDIDSKGLIVPFRLAVVPSAGHSLVVLRTAGVVLPPTEGPNRWTVSFVVSLDHGSAQVALEHSRGFITGFTAE